MSPSRLVPIDTPDTRQRRPRRTALAHLSWIRTLPCIVTWKRENVEAAHIRYGDPKWGKRAVGMGEKPDDRWTVPLSHSLHVGGPESQHANGEREWWARVGIDPLPIALALWGVSQDDDAARDILRAARPR